MHSLQKLSILFALFIVSSTDAFTSSKCAAKSSKLSAISAGNSGRRAFFRYAAGLASGGAILTSGGTQAYASYSAYTNREKDWQERKEAGQIAYSNSRDLRAQLQEIAPMNSEKSKMFCPNGPSSNVSPMMENRCGERQAMPSVFGRSDDILGNSIPGRYPSVGGSSSLSADTGGFPKY